jgi:hypothetical protein
MENVFTAAEPFLVLANLIGVFPKSFDGPARKGFLKGRLRDWVLSVVSLTVLVSTIGLVLFSKESFRFLAVSEIGFQGWYIIAYLNCFILVGLYIHQLWKRKNIVKLLNLIRSFDDEVSN